MTDKYFTPEQLAGMDNKEVLFGDKTKPYCPSPTEIECHEIRIKEFARRMQKYFTLPETFIGVPMPTMAAQVAAYERYQARAAKAMQEMTMDAYTDALRKLNTLVRSELHPNKRDRIATSMSAAKRAHLGHHANRMLKRFREGSRKHKKWSHLAARCGLLFRASTTITPNEPAEFITLTFTIDNNVVKFKADDSGDPYGPSPLTSAVATIKQIEAADDLNHAINLNTAKQD